MRRSVQGLIAAASGLAVLSAATIAAQADDRWWHDDIHHFHERDIGVWRGGHWFHGGHLGRAGWWWVVGGVWYWYPTPVYPYPDPYVPPAAAPVPPQYYYYCSAPPGYYPQVPACRVPWQPVPAGAPAAAAVAPAPQPPPPPAASNQPPPPDATQPPPQPAPVTQDQNAPPPNPPATTANGQNCHQYQQQVTINGQQQETTGTVCQQPDGTWRVVN